MDLRRVEWGGVTKAAAKEFSKDDVPGMAAEMAFHFILALFPFAIFLAALTGFVGRFVGETDLLNTILDYLAEALPEPTWEAIRGPLTQAITTQSGGALSIGVLLALLSASNGVATVMKGFNRAYGIEETRNFIMKKVVAIALTVVLTVLLIAGFILLIFGGAIGGWLAGQFGLGGAFAVVWNVLRYPLVLVGISFALAILYWKGPNIEQQFEWLTPGSVLTTLAWFLATVAFGLYVQFYAAESFRNTYGAIAGLILFLLYLYLTSMVILIGAEFNAETTKRYDPEVIREKITDPRKQLPGKQPDPDPRAAAEAGVTREQVADSNRRSAEKLATGGGSPATATMAARAAAAPAGEGGLPPALRPEVSRDPAADARLRALRERPLVSAAARARAELAGLPPAARARRARAAVAAFALSAATAAGGVLLGLLRRPGGR